MRGELEPYLVSKMQCMGSPRYCLAAERTERLVSIKTVTLDCRMAWRWREERQIFIINFGKSAHHSNTPHLSSATDYQQQKINSRNSVKVTLRCWRYQITINEEWVEITAH